MLKVYYVGLAAKIDDKDWEALDVWKSLQIVDEEKANNPEIIEYDCSSSWEEQIYKIADKTDAVYCDKTLFKKRPYLCITYSKNSDEPVKYFEGAFKRISFCKIYVETNTTLEAIMRRCSADDVIAYLKERGMATCPMLKD